MRRKCMSVWSYHHQAAVGNRAGTNSNFNFCPMALAARLRVASVTAALSGTSSRSKEVRELRTCFARVDLLSCCLRISSAIARAKTRLSAAALASARKASKELPRCGFLFLALRILEIGMFALQGVGLVFRGSFLCFLDEAVEKDGFRASPGGNECDRKWSRRSMHLETKCITKDTGPTGICYLVPDRARE